MSFLQKLLLLFTLSFCCAPQAWPMEPEQSKKSIYLAPRSDEDVPKKWLPEYENYCTQKEGQKQRLKSERKVINVECTHSYVRFVKDIPSLTVGYGVLFKDQTTKIPELKLDNKVYQELAVIGTSLKIINGYINECDDSHLNSNPTFTPDTTNVFVPHISYVIQWKENTLPELVPGGTLYDKDGCSIVFMSGSKPFDEVENFYNFIYKEKEHKKISIYTGNKVTNVYVPYVLYDAVKELDIFKDQYLGEQSSEMLIKFPYTENANDAPAKAKNRVHFTFNFLALLFLNDFGSIFENRQDTINRLLEDFLKKEKIKIKREEAEEKKPFKKDSLINALQNNRLKFQQAALSRIKNALPNLKEKKEKKLAENVIGYISYSLNPEQLKNFEESKKFWEIIQALNNHITCLNPDSPKRKSCTGAERLRKYALQSYNGSHTEPLFIKLMRAEPSLLIQGLEKIISAAEKASSTEKPNLLGIVVDSFSWLDVCKGCGDYLHTNNEWSTILKDVVSLNEIKEHFTLPLSTIDSLFRVVSQERYNGSSNIIKAGGGSDYTVSGWDYKVLSEMRYTLGTRTDQQESQLYRDQIFEKITTVLTREAFTQPLEFWLKNYASWPLEQRRPFADNIMEILALRFPEENVVKIGKIQIEKKKKNFDIVYQLCKSFLSTSFKFSEDDIIFLGLIAPSLQDKQNKFDLKPYFGEACLKKAQSCFQENEAKKGWGYLYELEQSGFMYKLKELLKEVSLKQITEYAINYWEEHRTLAKADAFSSPAMTDKDTCQKLINLLWELAYQQGDYKASLDTKQRKELKKILEKSNLEKPKFASQ